MRVLIARGPQLAALRERGVQVLSVRGDFAAHPHATDDPREIGEVDYVFLGLKAHSYAKVAVWDRSLGRLGRPSSATNVDVAVGIGARLGCRAFNALYGRRIDGTDPAEQDDLAVSNLAIAGKAAGEIDGHVLIEPVSGAAGYRCSPRRTRSG